MELKVIYHKPEGYELIIGQGNFSLKTVEYLYDAVFASSPDIRFGVAINDGSSSITRFEGNDEELTEVAKNLAKEIGAGHVFVIVFRNAFPVHVINAVKPVPTVVNIFVATGNPIGVVVAEENSMRAVLGVMDGYTSKGYEDVEERKQLLKKLGFNR